MLRRKKPAAVLALLAPAAPVPVMAAPVRIVTNGELIE
jgi:hypothetical protein